MTNGGEIELDSSERLTRDYILPILPEGWKGYSGLEGDELQLANSILAQEYVEHGSLRKLWKPLLLIGVYDALFHLEPVVYGLVASAIGSISLAIPAMHTPHSLAGDTLLNPEDDYVEIRKSAKRSVKTNIGIVIFVVGFVIQIAARVDALGTEVLGANLLTGVVPSYSVILFTALVWEIYRRV